MAQTETIRTEIQNRAQGAILQHAFFRWESALVIALTLILTILFRRPFFFWPPFGWPLLGLLGLALIVYSSLTDAETNAQVVLRMFQEQFNPRTITNPKLREKVETALEYQRRIETQIRQQREGMIRDRLEQTANQITDWLANIYELALRLDRYDQDDLLARERETVPKELERLEARRKLESNPAVQGQLDEVIQTKAKHWESIRALDARMRQASLQLDQSVTALATIYSQVQLIDAQSIGSGRAERLQEDIREQVARLNDLVSSINQVYDYSTKGLG